MIVEGLNVPLNLSVDTLRDWKLLQNHWRGTVSVGETTIPLLSRTQASAICPISSVSYLVQPLTISETSVLEPWAEIFVEVQLEDSEKSETTHKDGIVDRSPLLQANYDVYPR